jgi:hypothetical protein
MPSAENIIMIDYFQCLLRCKSKSRESDRHTIELQVMTIDNGKTPLIELCIATQVF